MFSFNPGFRETVVWSERQTGRGGINAPSVHLSAVKDRLRDMSVKRKTSRRCLAGLFTEARQELIAQKRDVQLERMLLPDAPPRTRPKKGISPERESCIMVVPPVRLSVDYSPIKRVEAEASTSGVACSSELNFSEPTEFECSMSDIGAEVVLPASSSPYISRPSDIGVIDENINGTIEKWLDEVCSSDDDLDIDDANVSLAIVQERDAAQEPACDSDLTVFQEKVLQREDVANDRALRNILSEELCTFSWTQEIAIDESLLKWHGRLSFSQKIKSKAAQIGVKTYELCESSSGYLWRFFVYAGKDKPTLFTSDGIDGRDTEKEQKNERPFALESLHRFDEDETNDSPNNDVTIVASPDKITTDEIGEKSTIVEQAKALAEECSLIGLKINIVYIDKETRVQKVKYLGCIIKDTNSREEEIEFRIQGASVSV
ncbi:unnamed protein product, partial [Iphiclides podalirius]